MPGDWRVLVGQGVQDTEGPQAAVLAGQGVQNAEGPQAAVLAGQGVQDAERPQAAVLVGQGWGCCRAAQSTQRMKPGCQWQQRQVGRGGGVG